jgi:hypothetical protein
MGVVSWGMIAPKTRHRFAKIALWICIVATVPGSWLIPLLDDVWFERATLFLCFLGLVIPAYGAEQTTDVRMQQED